MEITLNLIQLFVISLALIGITVIFMTHLFIKYLLKHFFKKNVNNDLHFKLWIQQKDLWVILIYWLGAMTVFVLIPVSEIILQKYCFTVIGITFILKAVYHFPKFWKISLKPPTQKS